MLEALYEEIKAYLEEWNKNPQAPYHSNEHMLGTWEIAKQLWEAEKLQPGFSLVAPEPVMLATLMTGVLFHDFGHSGGRTADRKNIDNAIRKVKHFIAVESDVIQNQFRAQYADSFGYLLWGSVAIINVTEFPFVVKPYGKLESIMRDADLLYAVMSGDTSIILEKLRTEIQVQYDREMAPRLMYEGQCEFMKKAEFFTDSGKQLWEQYSGPYLEKMRLAVLNDECIRYLKNKRCVVQRRIEG